MGYHGASTRDIARVAEVNETSIYRYYPRKRDLFVATLEAEFSKVRLRADLISKLSAAPDAKAAMRALMQVMMEAVMQQRALVRLVHFSVLEFGADLHEVYDRHHCGSRTAVRWAESQVKGSFPGLAEVVRSTLRSLLRPFWQLRTVWPLMPARRH